MKKEMIDGLGTNGADLFPMNPDTRKCGSVLLEVIWSNPNGDTENKGAPRMDLQTGKGLISPQAAKRKIRDVALMLGERLYVSPGADLAAVQESYGCDSRKLVEDCWDTRLFGGVMTRSTPKLQAGPIQFEWGVSVDPILIEYTGLTRVAGSRDEEKERKKKEEKEEVDYDADDSDSSNRANMGTAARVLFGLYRINFFYNPNGALKKPTPHDLLVFWTGLVNGWDLTRSNTRTACNVRRIAVWDYGTTRSGELSHVALRRLQVKRKESVLSPQSYEDYEITLDNTKLGRAVTVYDWEDGQMIGAVQAAAK